MSKEVYYKIKALGFLKAEKQFFGEHSYLNDSGFYICEFGNKAGWGNNIVHEPTPKSMQDVFDTLEKIGNKSLIKKIIFNIDLFNLISFSSSYNVDRINFPTFKISTNPSISLREIKTRRFNIINQAQKLATKEIQLREDIKSLIAYMLLNLNLENK